MSVQSLVKKAVDGINAKNEQSTEARVNQLVNNILSTEASIKDLQDDVDAFKKELKELEMPKPVTLEL